MEIASLVSPVIKLAEMATARVRAPRLRLDYEPHASIVNVHPLHDECHLLLRNTGRTRAPRVKAYLEAVFRRTDGEWRQLFDGRSMPLYIATPFGLQTEIDLPGRTAAGYHVVLFRLRRTDQHNCAEIDFLNEADFRVDGSRVTHRHMTYPTTRVGTGTYRAVVRASSFVHSVSCAVEIVLGTSLHVRTLAVDSVVADAKLP
jgi:hypothetical protein